MISKEEGVVEQKLCTACNVYFLSLHYLRRETCIFYHPTSLEWIDSEGCLMRCAVKTYSSWRAGRPWKASSGTIRMALLHRSRSCSNDRPLNRFPSRLSIWLLAKSLETKNGLTGSGVFLGWCGICVQLFIDSLSLQLQGLMWWVSHLDAVTIQKPFVHPILGHMGSSRWSHQDSCCLLLVPPYNVS